MSNYRIESFKTVKEHEQNLLGPTVMNSCHKHCCKTILKISAHFL